MDAFVKVHAAGNDFILVDGRKVDEISPEQIRFVCHRHMGIGADGLILVKPADGATFQMKYFNADGSSANMCGNGARSAVAFAHYMNFFDGIRCTFLAGDGKHEGFIEKMQFPFYEIRVNIFWQGNVIPVGKNAWFINTGVPHVVCKVDNVDEVDLSGQALVYRFREDLAPGGVNVDFVDAKKGLRIRTYERGVEEETLSCGTGVSAAALVAFQQGWVSRDKFSIEARGGNFEIEIDANSLWLKGPVTFIASLHVFDFFKN
jgi:diaminopimelate epimerase